MGLYDGEGEGLYDGEGAGLYDGEGVGLYDGEGAGLYDGEGRAGLLPFPKSSRMETGTWSGATIPFLSRDKGGLDYGVHLLPFLSTVGNK